MSPDDGQRQFTFAETLNFTMLVLLAIMTAVFLAQVLIPSFGVFALNYLAMDTAAFLSKLHLWQAVTSIFLHGSIMHFVMNMVFFVFFGSALANGWGRRDFLTYFFVCGVGASLCFYLFNVLRPGYPDGIKGLGASGAIFGLMIAYAMVYGERTILAFFMIPMKAKYFIAICFAIEILALWLGMQDGVSHIAHISGAVIGAIYLKKVWRRQDALAGTTNGPASPASRLAGLEVMDDDK